VGFDPRLTFRPLPVRGRTVSAYVTGNLLISLIADASAAIVV
jgi:hypothetical protein